jgi:hypothetical protein
MLLDYLKDSDHLCRMVDGRMELRQDFVEEADWKSVKCNRRARALRDGPNYLPKRNVYYLHLYQESRNSNKARPMISWLARPPYGRHLGAVVRLRPSASLYGRAACSGRPCGPEC